MRLNVPWCRFLDGGGTTIIGTLAGSAYTLLELSFAAEGILYVVGELLHIGKMQGQPHRTAMAGLLIGFLAAFGPEMVIEIGIAISANCLSPTGILKHDRRIAGELIKKPSGQRPEGFFRSLVTDWRRTYSVSPSRQSECRQDPGPTPF